MLNSYDKWFDKQTVKFESIFLNISNETQCEQVVVIVLNRIIHKFKTIWIHLFIF